MSPGGNQLGKLCS